MIKLDGDGTYWNVKKKARKLALEREVSEIRKKLTSEDFYVLKEYFKLENDK